MCHAECGVNAYVKDGKLLRVEGMREHPKSRGRLCLKGEAAPELVYDPDRLQYPMKRVGARGEGKWQRISWEEALDIIATKLKDVKEKYGPQALALVRGCESEEGFNLFERFLNVYGTPNELTTWGLCYSSKHIGHLFTYGRIPIPECEKSNCIVLWGINPPISHYLAPMSGRHFGMDEVFYAKEKGAKLIVIDPRRTEVAEEADLWVPIRPATDLALALAMINVIINEDLYDKEFVEKWTIGFDKLVEHVREYTPEWAEKITWIPADTIREVARMYAKNRPAVIETFEGTDHKTNSAQTQRALSILRAIVGSLDVAGGELLPSKPPPFASIALAEKRPPEPKPIGARKHPLFVDIIGEAVPPMIPEAILTGEPYPIKVVIAYSSNPLLMWPNSNKVREAFEKLDFLVVSDLYMNDTARLADIVLPGVTYLERDNFSWMFWVFSNDYLVVRQKVIEPVGEGWPDWKFLIELAKRMGYGESFPWKDGQEIIDRVLKPTGITFKDLKENPIIYTPNPVVRYKKYEREGFNTPSKKVEIYSERFKRYGYDPLPVYTEPKEGPISTPDLVERYPLILTAFRTEHMHSWTQNLPSVHEVVPENFVEIHPEDAKKRGIQDGDKVIVEGARGSIEVRAKVTGNIIPGVVAIPAGFGHKALGSIALQKPGGNVNVLTNDKARDPISGIPAYRENLCNVRKA